MADVIKSASQFGVNGTFKPAEVSVVDIRSLHRDS
jgi:hypothetical protein